MAETVGIHLSQTEHSQSCSSSLHKMIGRVRFFVNMAICKSQNITKYLLCVYVIIQLYPLVASLSQLIGVSGMP